MDSFKVNRSRPYESRRESLLGLSFVLLLMVLLLGVQVVHAATVNVYTAGSSAQLGTFICDDSVTNCVRPGNDDSAGSVTIPPVSLNRPANAMIVCSLGNCLNTQLTTSGAYVLKTPTGWTNPTTPPTSGGATKTTWAGFSTPDEACMSNFNNSGFDIQYTGYNTSNNYCQGYQKGVSSTPTDQVQINPVLNSCNAGYTAGGGTCTLSNAAVVMKPADGHCNIVRSGSSYSVDAQDPDCERGVNPSGASAVTKLNRVQASGSSQAVSNSGRSVTTTLPTATSIQIVVNVPDANGNTKQQTITIGTVGSSGAGAAIADGAVVTGIKGGTFEGVGLSASATVTPAPSGGSGAADTPADFCELHPTSSVCLTGAFSGGCGSPPSCSGDAIQCAVASAVFETKCQVVASSTTQSTLGENLVTGADPLAGSLPTIANATDVDLSGSISTTTFWTSACPADLTVPLGASSFVLPWSRLCTVFTLLGYCMVALAGIACARIVGVWG